MARGQGHHERLVEQRKRHQIVSRDRQRQQQVDPAGVIRYASVHDLDVGRNPDEVLRVLDALRTGALCPCNWKPGDATLDAA